MSDEMKYDEDDAVKFIRTTLSPEADKQYTDDEILFIIDTIWDYYEKNGYLSLDAEVTDEEDLNIDGLLDYVKKEIKNDGELIMDPADIEQIVKGELQYEESLEDFI